MYSQPGILTPGSYTSGSKIAGCYKAFYKAPGRFDTLKRVNTVKAQRVWRIIDFKEPATKALFSTSKGCEYTELFEVFKFGVLSGQVNAFSTDKFDKDALKHRIDISQFLSLMTFKDTVLETEFDADGNSTETKKIIERQINSNDLAGFVFCEDWFFDNHWSQLDKKMLYICPIFKNEKTHTEYPLFYLYYDECRELLSSFKAINKRSVEAFSYDAFILSHQYPGFVVKTTNVFNRTIAEYKKGTDIEGEHDKSLKMLHNSESDLFER